jgi:hypothetical protein
MAFNALAFAVLVASRRELFQIPLPARQQAVLPDAEPAFVRPAAYPADAFWTEPRQLPLVVDVQVPQDARSLSWLGVGAVAAALSAAAISRGSVKKTRRSLVVGQFPASVVDLAASASENRLCMFALAGEQPASVDGHAFAKTLRGIRGSIEERKRLRRGLPRSASSSRHAAVRMLDNPLDAVAAPLRKFEGTGAASNDILKDLPIEVIALFAVILIVGVAGLVKNSGALPDSAPTVDLGGSRQDLAGQATKEMTSDERQRQYIDQLSDDIRTKRGSSGQNFKGKKTKKAKNKR